MGEKKRLIKKSINDMVIYSWPGYYNEALFPMRSYFICFNFDLIDSIASLT